MKIMSKRDWVGMSILIGLIVGAGVAGIAKAKGQTSRPEKYAILIHSLEERGVGFKFFFKPVELEKYRFGVIVRYVDPDRMRVETIDLDTDDLWVMIKSKNTNVRNIGLLLEKKVRKKVKAGMFINQELWDEAGLGE